MAALTTPKKYPFMLTFPKSKRADFQSISRLFKKADLFKESETEVLLCFGKTKAQVSLFQTIYQIAGHWRGTLVFTKGEHEPKPWLVLEVLRCYVGSFDSESPKSYCTYSHSTEKRAQRGTITISLKVPKPTFFPDDPNIEPRAKAIQIPCRKLKRDITDGSRDEVLFLANESRCAVCPNFKML